MAESEQFEKGLEIRRKVLGADYVDGGLAKADDFMMAFQRITRIKNKSTAFTTSEDIPSAVYLHAWFVVL